MSSAALTIFAAAAMIAGGLLLVAGVVVVYSALAMVRLARESRRWPATSGRIARSEVRERHPLIRYRYEVDGEGHEGRDVTTGGWPFRTARSAVRQVQRYPVGAQVPVFYDPRQPRVAVIKPGLTLDVLYLPLVATVLMLAALGLLSWSLWQLVSG